MKRNLFVFKWTKSIPKSEYSFQFIIISYWLVNKSHHSTPFCMSYNYALSQIRLGTMQYKDVSNYACEVNHWRESPNIAMISAESKNDEASTVVNSEWSDEKLLSPRSMFSNGWYSADSSTMDPIPQMVSLRLCDDASDGQHHKPWNQNNTRIGQSHSSSSFSGTMRNYTFTDGQLRDIQRTNACLMDKLQRAKRSNSTSAANVPIVPVAVASATINRQRKAREIHRTNSILIAKLEAIAKKRGKKLQ